MRRRFPVMLVAVLVLLAIALVLHLREVDPILGTYTVPRAAHMAVDTGLGRTLLVSDKAITALDTTTGKITGAMQWVKLGSSPTTTIDGLVIDSHHSRALIVEGVPWPTALLIDTGSLHLLRSYAGIGGGCGDDPAVDEDSGHFFALEVYYREECKMNLYFLDVAKSGLQGVHSNGGSMIVDEHTHRLFVSTQVIDDVTYLPSGSSVTMVDPQTGALLKEIGTPNCCSSLMAVAEPAGRVFVFGEHTLMLDARTGALIRTLPVYGDLFVASPAGKLFVASPAGKLFVTTSCDAVTSTTSAQTVPSQVTILDARTGTVLRTIRIAANPTAIAVDALADRVYVTSRGATASKGNQTGYGEVTVLDGRSGAVEHTVSLMVDPAFLVLDPARQRALIFGDRLRDQTPLSRWTQLVRWLEHLNPWDRSRNGTGTLSMPPVKTGQFGEVVLDTARL